MTNLTLSELEEQVRILSERLRKAVDLIELHEKRLDRLEQASTELADALETPQRDTEYDRMDKLDSDLDAEIRREAIDS